MWTRPKAADSSAARQLSLRSRLSALFLGVNVVGLLLVCGGLALHGARRELRVEAETLGELISLQSMIALEAEDSIAAEMALLAVTSNDRVLAAALFDRRGGRVAQFRRDYDSEARLPERPAELGLSWGPHGLEHTVAVVSGQNRVGHVHLRLSDEALLSEQYDYAAIALLAVLVGSLPAVLALRILGAQVVAPIQRVSSRAEALAEGELRSEPLPEAADEIGVLAVSFNRLNASLVAVMHTVVSETDALRNAAITLENSSREVTAQACEQEQSVDGSASSLETMLAGGRLIHDAVTALEADSGNALGTVQDVRRGTEIVIAAADDLARIVEIATSASAESSATMEQIGESVEQQSCETRSAVGTLKNLIDSGESVVDRMARVGALAEESARTVGSGRGAVSRTVASIETIEAGFGRIEGVVSDLSKDSKSIGNIVGDIDAITSETQLLSLNASIIAAQAGESGAAFAVVASEVKDLAQRTADLAGEIGGRITEVQNSIEAAVVATKEGRDSLCEGRSCAHETSEIFRTLLEKTGEVQESAEQHRSMAADQIRELQAVADALVTNQDGITQIVIGVREQQSATREIAKSMEEGRQMAERLRSVTAEQTTACEATGRSFEQVNERAQEIGRAVEIQRTKSTDIDVAGQVFRGGARAAHESAASLRDLASQVRRRADALHEQIGWLRLEEDET